MRLFIILFLLFLASCSSPAPLSPGLSQRMDLPNAQLDKREAINLINDFRYGKNLPPLQLDDNLNKLADQLAKKYALSGINPRKPQTVNNIRTSAGYVNFAQTFSGWRNIPDGAKALLNPENARAGIGVYYSANSNSGTYWVLLLAKTSKINIAQ